MDIVVCRSVEFSAQQDMSLCTYSDMLVRYQILNQHVPITGSTNLLHGFYLSNHSVIN
jgi:hypothetical protein